MNEVIFGGSDERWWERMKSMSILGARNRLIMHKVGRAIEGRRNCDQPEWAPTPSPYWAGVMDQVNQAFDQRRQSVGDPHNWSLLELQPGHESANQVTGQENFSGRDIVRLLLYQWIVETDRSVSSCKAPITTTVSDQWPLQAYVSDMQAET